MPKNHDDEEQLHDIRFGNDVLGVTAKAQATTEIDKLDYIKI